MKSPEEITRQLMEPFPVDVIEEKNGLLYVPHEIIRERLILATDNKFNWTVDQVLFRDDGVTRRPNDRQTGEVVRPISMIVIGTLMIEGLGMRAGIGAHPLDAGAGEDAAYKSAESDALKRAAMAFGVGLHQLYIETGQSKRVGSSQSRSSAPQQQNRSRSSAPAQNAPQPAPAQQQNGSGGSYTIRDPDSPATDKQIGMIKSLLEQHGWDPADFILEEDDDFPRISKGDAHTFIDALKSGNLPEGVSDPGKA